MDTNTIMLIALAIIVVLSALAIWLANRGSGVEDPHRAIDPVADDEPSEGHTTTPASTTKVVDTKPTPDTKVTDSKVTSDVKVVDNTKKTSTAKTTVDPKSTNKINEVRDTKNPPKNR